MKQKLTQTEQIYYGLKKQHVSFKPVLQIHRFIILKEISLHNVTFKQLKISCATTDGNIASHTRQMEIAGLLEVIKEFVGKYPQTSYKITKKGMKLYEELEKYLTDLMSTSTLRGKCSA